MLVALALLLTIAPPPSDTTHCTQAAAFLRTEQQMAAIVEPDTMNDWRSQQRVVGCRITASGATTLSLRDEAIRLYDRLRAARWMRTPDPRDAPNEASMRFRWQQSDCLFNVSRDAMLFTDAEQRAAEAAPVKQGESRYAVFVQCFAALPAASRESIL